MEGGMHSGHATSIKNGLIPSKDPRNLELVLRYADAKAFYLRRSGFYLTLQDKTKEKPIPDEGDGFLVTV
jgi:hypothetical protein